MIPNGIFTITNIEGEHRTFSIKTQDKDAKFAPGERVIALLSGADNEADYTGFAFVDKDGAIHVWKKRRDSRVFNWYADMLAQAALAIEGKSAEEEPDATFTFAKRLYRVQAAKRCLVCNRRLTTPESIKAGIGPICAGGGRDDE